MQYPYQKKKKKRNKQIIELFRKIIIKVFLLYSKTIRKLQNKTSLAIDFI